MQDLVQCSLLHARTFAPRVCTRTRAHEPAEIVSYIASGMDMDYGLCHGTFESAEGF